MFESCAPWEQKARGFTLEVHSATSSALNPAAHRGVTASLPVHDPKVSPERRKKHQYPIL